VYSRLEFWLSIGPMVALPLIAAVTLMFFSILVAFRGYPKNSKAARVDTWFVTRLLIEYWYWLVSPIEKLAVRWNVSPDTITWVGLFFALASAPAFATGHMGLGGWLIIIGGSFDIIDGLVARAVGRTTTEGAFLDSTLDRLADLATFGGLAVYYRNTWVMALVMVALAATYMVSYTRARGESLNVECKVGGMQRGERIFFIGITSALSPMVSLFVETGVSHPVHYLTVGGIGVIAIFGSVTAVIRGVAIYRELRFRELKKTSNVVDFQSSKLHGQGGAKTLK